jgi:hypothetical protein
MSDVLDESTKQDEKADPSSEGGTLPQTQERKLEFRPVTIKGEPLSETIIRDRRRD